MHKRKESKNITTKHHYHQQQQRGKTGKGQSGKTIASQTENNKMVILNSSLTRIVLNRDGLNSLVKGYWMTYESKKKKSRPNYMLSIRIYFRCKVYTQAESKEIKKLSHKNDKQESMGWCIGENRI